MCHSILTPPYPTTREVSTVTIQPVSTLLRKINQEPVHFCTITGCQELYAEAVERHEAIMSEVRLIESRLQILHDIADDYRAKLQHWHAKNTCSRHRQACRSGQCGCSYAHLVRLWSALEVQREQTKQLNELKHEAVSHQDVASRIIAARLAHLCKIPVYVLGFAEIMQLCGDLTRDEWNFISMFHANVTLSGTPYELLLVVETSAQTLKICWDQFGERIQPG